MSKFSTSWKHQKAVCMAFWGFQWVKNWNICSKWVKWMNFSTRTPTRKVATEVKMIALWEMWLKCYSRSKSFLRQNLMSSVISVSTQQIVHPKSELLSQTKSMFKLVGMLHYVKSVYIQSFSGTYFPVFGLNTDQKKTLYAGLFPWLWVPT